VPTQEQLNSSLNRTQKASGTYCKDGTDPSYVLIDVRDESSYKLGHIVGAVSLPIERLNRSANVFGNDVFRFINKVSCETHEHSLYFRKARRSLCTITRGVSHVAKHAIRSSNGMCAIHTC